MNIFMLLKMYVFFPSTAYLKDHAIEVKKRSQMYFFTWDREWAVV